MIRCLGAVFYLAQSLVDVGSGFTYGFCEQLRIHEMGAGAGGEVAAVLYQTHTANIDLALALDGIFDRAAGFCEGRRIEDHDVELLTSCL